MDHLTTTSPESVVNGKTRPRPTGEHIDRYKNVNRWSYRRWAWEFLRRNPEFITECKRVKYESNEVRQMVAQQFGLTRFKEYKEAYKGASGYPKYQSDAIASWTNLNSEDYKKKRAKNLSQGEVMICFDLNAALKNKQALRKQLQLAEQRLQKRLADYAAQQGERPCTPQPKPNKFVLYLRLLDALADGKSTLECAHMLHPERSSNMDPTEARGLVKDQIEAAKKYSQSGYRSLSLIRGKPQSKEFQLSGY